MESLQATAPYTVNGSQDRVQMTEIYPSQHKGGQNQTENNKSLENVWSHVN